MLTEISADARALADHLAAVPIGGTVTLSDMSRVIGRDMARHRHIFYSAARVLARESGAQFASVRNIGYKRLSATRAVEIVGPSARRRIRRAARSGRLSLAATIAGANDLTPDVMLRASSEIATLGLIEHLARDATTRNAAPAPAAPEPVAMTARRLLGIPAP